MTLALLGLKVKVNLLALTPNPYPTLKP